MLPRPWLVIFKPAYAPFPPAPVEHRDLLQGGTVALPPLRTRDELARFADLGALGLPARHARRMPRLLELVNIQRRLLSLPPYPA